MTGLEEIEQFIAASTRPPMMDLFDIDLLEAEEGRSPCCDAHLADLQFHGHRPWWLCRNAAGSGLRHRG
jgi:hypothetical protein